MLTEICAELRNYFEVPNGRHFGKFTISGGSIAPLDFLQEGQYFRIIGSVFNDGVHQYPASDLTDEVFNGAVWGQCDSIYVAFAVLSLWAVLSGKGKLSMVFLALSFGFKLQAVFIIPVFLVMLFAKRIKFRDYFIFPLSYLLLISPAVIAGRPFKEAFLLYFDQATTVGSGLNYNSPSLFSLVSGNVNNSAASAVGVAATFICVFLVFYLTWKQRKNLSDKALLFVTLLFVVGIPFLLPHMHDRYFFMADVLTLLPAIIAPAFAPIAIMTSLASLICYFAYFNQAYFLPLQYGTILLIGVLVILLINTLYLINSNRGPKPFLQT